MIIKKKEKRGGKREIKKDEKMEGKKEGRKSQQVELSLGHPSTQ
jgi:hypothetical protein